jgi:NADH dehydrogenase
MGKTVIVIGAGFAGVSAVRVLAKNRKLKIIVIDKKNYHLFQPLLYQVATAGLNASDIAVPIRKIFSRYSNVTVLNKEVKEVDFKKKEVTIDSGTITYDYLIMACGSRYTYFGHDEWEKIALNPKSVERAIEIRSRILKAFEEAECQDNKDRQQKFLNFAIIGGGPTGVELAGAIAEMARFTLAGDFRNIQTKDAKIYLIEAGPRLLAPFSESLSDRAREDLARLGVDILTNTTVTQVEPSKVTMGDRVIEAQTIIWAAGVTGLNFNKTLGVDIDKRGAVIVQGDLSIKDYPEVFIAGDQASLYEKIEKPLPQLAAVAIQQGAFAGKTILKDLGGEKRPKFHYFDKGILATIGRNKAIAQFGKFKFTGSFAWLVWLVVHIWFLTGFNNKISVLNKWLISYITYNKGARLILEEETSG